MPFNSIEFLFYFLPVFLLVYYKFPPSWRNDILSVASLVFYGLNCGKNYWMLGLLVVLILWTYLMGQLMGKSCGGWLLPACMTIMVGLLAFFKLYKEGALLPAGFSFYLFQMAAYLIDVYRGNVQSENKLLHYGGKMLMFPRLLSGPIMESGELVAAGGWLESFRIQASSGIAGIDSRTCHESAAGRPSGWIVESGGSDRV